MVNVRAATGSGSSSSDGNRYENGDNPGSGDSSGGSRDVSASATVYVMAQRYVQTFVDPSPQYLTAVYRTLTRNFPELSGRPLEICDYTGERNADATVRELVLFFRSRAGARGGSMLNIGTLTF